uniref:Fibronectin, type III domain protein n=1 Tax=Solibacter usitatus (strain Ellin6076) TaxID=234267 RepID=Q02A09_SOLUE
MKRTCLLLLSVSLSAWAQAPSGLAVKAATSKKIDLAWSGAASGYTVQRRTLGGTYATIGTVTTAAYSDTAIDPYTTYQYQALANGTPTPSNQVTVGPPPSGFTVAAAAPGAAGSDQAGNYGYDLSMALDTNGDPAFAFLQQDPNNDSEYSDTQILFRSWNRAAYAWNPIVKVAATGDTATYFHNTLSLAVDSSTGVFAIYSEFEQGGAVKLYTSPDGAAWSLKASYPNFDSQATSPVVALAGGNVYLASIIDYVGVRYVSGKLSADPATWISKTAPIPAGTSTADSSVTLAMALDSAGNPGIAYWVEDMVESYNRILLYWRPAGSSAPTRVLDSQGHQSDGVSVRMVYRNLNPRILVSVQRADGGFGVTVHFVKSDNGGSSWSNVVLIPADGDSSTDYPFDLAIDSQDHGAAGFGQNSGSGNHLCQGPKLALSTDLATWKTCGLPNAAAAGSFDGYPGAISISYGGNDKLLFMWWDTEASPAGIYLYREPPAGASTAPSISSVVNGATFQPGIVAGSWVTITGANLADTSRIWADSDFNRGNVLPTNLNGTSVKINGLDAPVYYISPTQINVQAPAGINGSVNVVVTRDGVNSNTSAASAVAAAPGLFTYSLGGKTYPSALYNGTYTIVGDPALYGAALKAKTGDIIQLYATGLGSSPAGNIIQSPISFSSPVTATLGTTNVSVLGTALVAVGEFQINIQIPPMADGEYQLLLKVNGVATQTGVIIPVGH